MLWCLGMGVSLHYRHALLFIAATWSCNPTSISNDSTDAAIPEGDREAPDPEIDGAVPVDEVPEDAGVPDASADLESYEQPIDVVFKIHIEPQNGVAAYRLRRDSVESVRLLAESYGSRLTIHGNGEFWQFAAEEGDQELIRSWVDAGHDIGTHMHPVHEDPDGSHSWANTTPAQEGDIDFMRELYADHHDYLQALLPDVVIDQSTPYNSLESNFVQLMTEFGYTVTGGGRHEVSVSWLGHHPFFPWRIGETYLEEDLSSPVLIVHHQPQIGEADSHGPIGGRVFEDQRLEHLKVQFLQLYLNRMYAERTDEPNDRVWMFGFLTHDNKSGESVLALIDEWFRWLTDEFGAGRHSLRGNSILRFASFSEVRDHYEAWEAEHPGVSSVHVDTPVPIDPRDPTIISDETSQSIYPHEFWGMAQLLKATEDTVVDYVGELTNFEGSGVQCHELGYGGRDDPERSSRWLCWREADGEAHIDVSEVVGADQVRRWDPRTGESSVVNADEIVVADEPVLFDRSE